MALPRGLITNRTAQLPGDYKRQPTPGIATTATVLGIDPATRSGWAWHTVGDPAPPCYGALDYHAFGTGERLIRFRDDLAAKIAAMHVTHVAYEDAHFGARNHLTMAFHGEMRGIIRMVCAEAGIPCRGYKPNAIKKFWTGFGLAKKPQMMAACRTWLGIEVSDPDAADALAILALAKDEIRLAVMAGVTPWSEAKRKARGRGKAGTQRTMFGK